MSSSIMERIAGGTVLGAEGYVFELERRGYIKAGPFVPEVVLDFPDAVAELHREFLRAGAEVMVALTYYAHREKLRHVGREGDLEAMNRQAVRIARQVAREGDALVAGNVCNTWAYDPDDPASKQTVRDSYAEQLGWAVEEGIDFVISETNDYLGEALIALEVIGSLGLPAMVTLAPTQPDRTRDGYEYAEACRILEAEGAQIVGLNCDRGPATMLPLITGIREAVDCAVAIQPVNGRFPSLLIRSAAPASRWLRSRCRPVSSGWITWGSAAARARTTSGPWPRRWAARSPRGSIRLRWSCIPCSVRTYRRRTRRSCTPGPRERRAGQGAAGLATRAAKSGSPEAVAVTSIR
jgi:methionine synthase I (cobalamin-dependent)